MNFRTMFNGPLAWSLISIAVVVVAVVMMVPAVFAAGFTSNPDEGVLDEAFTRLMNENEEALETFESRFVGRSAFYLPRVVRAPARTPPRRTAPVKSEPSEPLPPPPKPKPRRYEGPDIQAFVGDEVWFVDNIRVRAGTEGSNGVKVLSVQAPWKATLLYRGWEGDVDLFESKLVGLVAGAPPKSNGLAGIVDETPEEDVADESPTENPDESPAENPDEKAEDGSDEAPAAPDDTADEDAESPKPAAEEPEAKAGSDGDASKDSEEKKAVEDDGLTDEERDRLRRKMEESSKSREERVGSPRKADKPDTGADPAPPE